MQQTDKEYVCLKCGLKKQRFIEASKGSPLFVNIVSKDPKTSKFIEDIAQSPERRRTWYVKEGLVFIKENGKIVDVRKASDFAFEMAREVREQ